MSEGVLAAPAHYPARVCACVAHCWCAVIKKTKRYRLKFPQRGLRGRQLMGRARNSIGSFKYLPALEEEHHSGPRATQFPHLREFKKTCAQFRASSGARSGGGGAGGRRHFCKPSGRLQHSNGMLVNFRPGNFKNDLKILK